MGLFEDPDNPDDGCSGDKYVGPSQKDTQVQLVISVALGLTAFMSFCVRPSPSLHLSSSTADNVHNRLPVPDGSPFTLPGSGTRIPS